MSIHCLIDHDWCYSYNMEEFGPICNAVPVWRGNVAMNVYDSVLVWNEFLRATGSILGDPTKKIITFYQNYQVQKHMSFPMVPRDCSLQISLFLF